VQLIRDLSELPAGAKGGAVTIGNFDGVHRGHAKLLAQLVGRAHELSRASVVFTFDPHPARLLRPHAAPPPLTWIQRKAELLAELQVDYLVAYPTDKHLLDLSPEEFFQVIIQDALDAQAVVEGPNFYFGKNRGGNVETLAQLCTVSDITLDIVEPVADDAAFISSSRIRQLVSQGEMATVAEFLTQPYRIRGMVTHGAKRGRTLGFPTANLEAIDTLLPGEGVFAGRAFVSSQRLPAAIHVGANKTFAESHVQVEVHIIDYEGDLYGQPLEVDFLAKLRESHTFASKEALIEQLAKDIATARTLAGQT
jgi:riboflavin kinase/FMN adenylyltransferase